MTPDEAADRTAAVIRAAALASTQGDPLFGLREAQYPAKGQTPKYPSLVLLIDNAELDYFSGEQHWEISVRGLLLTGLFNEQRHHIGEVDPLIAPLVDLFDASNPDGFLLKRSNGDICDGCLVTGVQLGGIGYGGQDHYGATITWNVKLRRFAS